MTRFRGLVWRHVPVGAEPLHLGWILKAARGRWNTRRPRMPCLYTALTPEGAIAGLDKHAALFGGPARRDLVSLRVAVDGVLDLTQARTRARCGVDLTFPEFTRHVKTLDGPLALALLARYPTARALAQVAPGKLARLVYDGQHHVGDALASALVAAARASVGAHDTEAYARQARYAAEDLTTLRARLRELDGELRALVERHDVGRHLVTIPGVGPVTAAAVLAETGDLSRFPDAATLASYAGLVPALRHSGKRTPARAGLHPAGNARLRRALFMATLVKAFYDRLVGRGKPKLLALMAAMRKLLTAVHSVARRRQPFVLPPARTPATAERSPLLEETVSQNAFTLAA